MLPLPMHRFQTLLIAALVAGAVSGCGQTGASEKKSETESHDSVGAGSRLFKALSRVSLSDALAIRALPRCNAARAGKILDADYFAGQEGDLNSRAAALWVNCEELYACSASAKKFLDEKSAVGGRVRLAFVDFSAAGFSARASGSAAPPRVRGIYHSGTKGVYLDSSVRSAYEGCHLLLHELVHLFDPGAQDARRDAFAVEYRAYYLQTAFSGELALADEPLRSRMGARPRFHLPSGSVAPAFGVYYVQTRDSLLDFVARMTGESADASAAKGFAPFQWEPQATSDRM